MKYLSKQLITAPNPAVTPEEAAAQLNIIKPDAAELSVLTAKVAAAADAVERYLHRPVSPQTWAFIFPVVQGALLEMYYDPVIEVESVSASGADLPEFELLPLNPPAVKVISTVPPGAEYLTVTARVGFDPLPPSVREAILQLTADLYEHRETQLETSIAVNSSFAFMLDRYKQMGAY